MHKKLLPPLCLTLFGLLLLIRSFSIPAMETNAAANDNTAAMQTSYKQTKDVPIIVLDAGHGGYDTGSVAMDGTYEKDITLSIVLACGELLQKQGYQVVYTRTSDEVSWSDDNIEDLATRITIGEDADADYFVSVHLNSSDVYNDGARGFEIYLNYENDTINQIASALQAELRTLDYTNDRGLKDTAQSPLYVIDNNSVPSMLAELGFISDGDDFSYLCSENGQAQLAKALANSIAQNVPLD